MQDLDAIDLKVQGSLIYFSNNKDLLLYTFLCPHSLNFLIAYVVVRVVLAPSMCDRLGTQIKQNVHTWIPRMHNTLSSPVR